MWACLALSGQEDLLGELLLLRRGIYFSLSLSLFSSCFSHASPGHPLCVCLDAVEATGKDESLPYTWSLPSEYLVQEGDRMY